MSQREYIRKGQDPPHNWLHGPIQPRETVPLSVGLPVPAGGTGGDGAKYDDSNIKETLL
jgi:hypothetical protein